MSLASVKQFFSRHAPDIDVIELEQSTATVALAAEGHGVEPAQIAKTLALRVGDEIILIVTRGDARLDNKKYKARFGTKARMLGFDEVEAETGHPVGGGLSLRPRQAPQRLLRRVAQVVRHRRSRRRCDQRRRPYQPGADGRADRCKMDRCLGGVASTCRSTQWSRNSGLGMAT